MNIEKISVIVSILSGIMQLTGYWFYNVAIYRGEIKPNLASWFLWGIGSLIASFSYHTILQDPVKEILPWCCSAGCVLTTVHIFYRKRTSTFREILEDMGAFEIWIVLLGLTAVIAGKVFEAELYANILIQVDTIISFTPLIVGVWVSPRDEKLKPWVCWVAGYSLMLVAVLMRLEHWGDLMYPVNLLSLSLITSSVILFRSKKSGE